MSLTKTNHRVYQYNSSSSSNGHQQWPKISTNLNLTRKSSRIWSPEKLQPFTNFLETN